jgi:molybdopterin converting factor small subunit
MRVSFLLWAQMRVTAGCSRIELELPEGVHLHEALERLYESRPELRAHRRTARAAVGNEYAPDSQLLRDGDEISLIPPVQGG